MHAPAAFLRSTILASAAAAALLSFAANAATKTVCTITVNSADERDIFRKNLPPGDYKFVELVERGRTDWLASACQAKVQCDALIISGHFDGGEEFYTDSNVQSEFLTVAEMEKASCSDSCPGVFANLKEVYLFGCNTLKPAPEQHVLSNRDRLRHIFKDVPVIYGFSSKAPLGRYAGPVLDKYFQSAGASEIASGKPSQKLLGLFAGVSMTATPGITDTDPQAKLRAEACRFLDERITPAQKVEFMHDVLKRAPAEVHLLQEQLEKFAASIGPKQRFESKTAAAFAAISRDTGTRERYLDSARNADDANEGTRMLAFARNIGWLTPAQEQGEFLRLLAARVSRDRLGQDEVNLACSRDRETESDPAMLRSLSAGVMKSSRLASSAALACLGNADAHSRVVKAMTSTNADDIAIAQTYFRHRPLTDVNDVRTVAAAIGKMPASGAQVRALEALARQRMSDAESLREIARLFSVAKSVEMQRAVASILIRADHRVLGHAQLAQTIRQHRIKAGGGEDVIDALMRVLQAG